MAERRYPLGTRDLARVFTPFHNVSYYAPEINAFIDAGMGGGWHTSPIVPPQWARSRPKSSLPPSIISRHA